MIKTIPIIMIIILPYEDSATKAREIIMIITMIVITIIKM